MTIQLPVGVRQPLAVPHARTSEPLYGKAERGLGGRRRRRLYTQGTDLASVQWRITHAELALWTDWFEDDLQAGALPFTMRVQGRLSPASTELVDALFTEPPRTTMVKGWATITAEVRITPHAGP